MARFMSWGVTTGQLFPQSTTRWPCPRSGFRLAETRLSSRHGCGDFAMDASRTNQLVPCSGLRLFAPFALLVALFANNAGAQMVTAMGLFPARADAAVEYAEPRIDGQL